MELKRYKLVKQDPNNNDQYLIGYYDTEVAAKDARLDAIKKYPTWIRSWEEMIVKRVDPDMILNPVATDYSHYIGSLIPDDEWKRVMKSDASAEIDINNCCCGYGGRTYYNLSKMIPKDWTVIDFGCAYNPQSYLFTQHARHIAIEPLWLDKDFHFEYFKAPNTELLFMTGQDFIEEGWYKTMDLNLDKTFAIVNFVPSGACNLMVRETFPNLWCYYPA